MSSSVVDVVNLVLGKIWLEIISISRVSLTSSRANKKQYKLKLWVIFRLSFGHPSFISSMSAARFSMIHSCIYWVWSSTEFGHFPRLSSKAPSFKLAKLGALIPWNTKNKIKSSFFYSTLIMFWSSPNYNALFYILSIH